MPPQYSRAHGDTQGWRLSLGFSLLPNSPPISIPSDLLDPWFSRATLALMHSANQGKCRCKRYSHIYCKQKESTKICMCNPSLYPWAMLVQCMELMKPEYMVFTLYLHLLCTTWFTHTECKCKGNCKGKKVKCFPFLALLLVLLVLVLYLHVRLHHTCTRCQH